MRAMIFNRYVAGVAFFVVVLFVIIVIVPIIAKKYFKAHSVFVLYV